MPFSIIINNVDLSDNVIAIGDVPYTFRNADHSLVFDYVDFNLSNTNLPTINTNDTVLIYSGSVLLFNGFIDTTKYNEDAYNFSISSRHVLSALEDIDVLDFTWDWEVFTREQQINVNSKQWPVIQIEKLLEALLHRAGNYNIDNSYLNVSQSLGVFYSQDSSFSGDPPEYFNVSAYLNEIYFLRHQIRCMGQKGLYNWDECLSSDDTKNDAAQLSTLLNLVCAFANIVIYPKDETTFYITNNNVVGNISRNYIYAKDTITERPRYTGYTMENLTASPHNSDHPYVHNYFPASMNRKIYYNPGCNTPNYKYTLDRSVGNVANRTSIKTVSHFTPIKHEPVFGDGHPLLATAGYNSCVYKIPIKEQYNTRIETEIQTEVTTSKTTFDENIINIEDGNRTSKLKTIFYVG